MNKIILYDQTEILNGVIEPSSNNQIIVHYPGTNVSNMVNALAYISKTYQMTYVENYGTESQTSTVYNKYVEMGSFSVDTANSEIIIYMSYNANATDPEDGDELSQGSSGGGNELADLQYKGNRIVLNDDTTIQDSIITHDIGDRIFIVLPGSSYVTALALFASSSKTSKMICYYGVYKTTFNGYTNIDSINLDTELDETHIYMSGTTTSYETEFVVPSDYLPEEIRPEEEDGENGNETNEST